MDTRSILVMVAVLGANRLGAQGSPYLHLGHPAYDAIGFLLDRGVIHGLSPVVRPYRRLDVARSVAGADTSRANRIERALLRRLRGEFASELRVLRSTEQGAVPSLAGDLRLEGAILTQRHRDPLRPEGKGLVTGAAEVDLRAVFGSVAVQSRLRSDHHYQHDPQFPNRVATNRFNQRAEDAYVEGQGTYARVMVGRLYREWAPAGIRSTLLSGYAPSFDQVAVRVGTEKVSGSLVAARLDDLPNDTRRYLALHRVDWRPTPDLALYGAEAMLYSGAGRDFELDFLNPVSFWFNENENQRATRNVASNNAFIGVGFWWRARRSLVLFGDFTLDDIQVDAVGEPPSYSFFAGAVWPRVAEAVALRASYAQVANLAYRTPTEYERYSFREVGLAWDVSDCDELIVVADWYPRPTLRVSPALTIRRRGEGDFRAPWPPFVTEPETVLSGVVERTVRLAVGGRWEWRDGVVGEWDLGPNFVSNLGHQRGVNDTELVGSVRVRVEIGRKGRL